MVKCYYLVYRLKESNILWIVNVMFNPIDLYKDIEDMISDREQYYIIMKYVDDIQSELNFTRFSVFWYEYTDIIIYKSKLLE